VPKRRRERGATPRQLRRNAMTRAVARCERCVNARVRGHFASPGRARRVLHGGDRSCGTRDVAPDRAAPPGRSAGPDPRPARARPPLRPRARLA